MPQIYLLIDGYNLMHAVGAARERYGPGDLERRRNRFLNELASRLTERERARATVVFDAGESFSDLPRTYSVERMTISFAFPGSDADSLIEELLAKHSAPRQVQVVSSDHRLQRAAKRRRASFIDSEHFAANLTRRGPIREGRPVEDRAARDLQIKRSGEVPAAELESWLTVFADAERLLIDPPPDGERPRQSSRSNDPQTTSSTQAQIARDESQPSADLVQRRAPEPGEDSPTASTSEDELRMWQARVDELADEREGWPPRRR